MGTPIDPTTGLPVGPTDPEPRSKTYKKYVAPTSWQAGGDDPLWEEILAAFNAEHQGKYGIPMNRPWGADPDAQASYNYLLGKYKPKWDELYTEDETFNPTTLGKGGVSVAPPPGGGGGGETSGGPGSSWAPWAASNAALLGGFKSPIQGDVLRLAKEQIAYASRRLKDIEEARKLGGITGTLTSEDKRIFQEMEDSAVSNLKSQVNSQTQDVWNTALSDLVNRGVLQGTVGQKILGTISSENVRTIAEGANAIRGQTNSNMLNAAIAKDQTLAQEAMGLLGLGQGYANADLEAELRKLGLGVQSNLGFAGLTSTEDISAQTRALQMALGQLQASTQTNIAGMGNQNAWNIANLQSGTQLKLGGIDAQTKLALAGLYGNAANTSSLYGLGGNALAAILGGLSKTDWWKSLGSAGSSSGGGDNYNPYYSGQSPNSWNQGYNASSGQYFWGED